MADLHTRQHHREGTGTVGILTNLLPKNPHGERTELKRLEKFETANVKTAIEIAYTLLYNIYI